MDVTKNTYRAKAEGGDHFELKEFTMMEDADGKSVQILTQTTRVHFLMIKRNVDKARTVLENAEAIVAAIEPVAREQEAKEEAERVAKEKAAREREKAAKVAREKEKERAAKAAREKEKERAAKAAREKEKENKGGD